MQPDASAEPGGRERSRDALIRKAKEARQKKASQKKARQKKTAGKGQIQEAG